MEIRELNASWQISQHRHADLENDIETDLKTFRHTTETIQRMSAH